MADQQHSIRKLEDTTDQLQSELNNKDIEADRYKQEIQDRKDRLSLSMNNDHELD